MKRKQLIKPRERKGLALWLGTFGDLMSLLLTFFILLLSMATFDKEKVREAIGSLQGTFAILEHGKETEITQPNKIQAAPITTDSPLDDVQNVFASLMTEYNEMTKISNSPGIDLEESEDGFILIIPDDLLFETGSWVISNPSGRVFLQRISMEINSFRDILDLRIIGHTDNIPYLATSSMDNWDLSNRRALSVAESLLSFGVDAKNLQVGGSADFYPRDSNDTESGRARNRRVDIHFSFVGPTKDKKSSAQEIIQNITQ